MTHDHTHININFIRFGGRRENNNTYVLNILPCSMRPMTVTRRKANRPTDARSQRSTTNDNDDYGTIIIIMVGVESGEIK